MAGIDTKTQDGTTLGGAPGGMTFFNDDLNAGVRNLLLAVMVDGEQHLCVYDSFEARGDGLAAIGTVGTTDLRVEAVLKPVGRGEAAVLDYALRNTSTERQYHVSGAMTVQRGRESMVQSGRGSGWDKRYCHTDNLRTERYPFCQMDSPYVRSLPVDTVHLGRGEDQPFPTIYFTDRPYGSGVLFGAASEEKTYLSWRFRRDPVGRHGLFRDFEIHHELPLSPGITVNMGETLTLDGLYIEIMQGTHPQDVHLNYVDYLAERLPLRGPKTELLRHAFYCSWNYGRFSEQWEEELLETACFIKENVPNCLYFLVDAGYLKGTEGQWGGVGWNFSDRFYPAIDDVVCPKKFPKGMKHFTGAIRELGLRPGIWWSPTCRLDSQLYKDHPDWFLQDAAGGPYRIGKTNGFLDLTVPDARGFLDNVLSVVVGEWGMEAVKMDFWSQSCEDRDARVRGLGQTALDTRRILFDLVRKHLPENGVFMTCVAVGMGDPFIGMHADTYRQSIDIGAGRWDEQIWNCLWTLPVLGIEGRKTFLYNPDSAGFNPDAPRNENLLRLTWCWITMGMQELGGYFTKLAPEDVLALRKFTDRCDRGYRCLCPDERAFRGEPLPEVLYVDYPDDSPTRRSGIVQSLALFNWTDEPRIVSVRRAAIGQSGPAEAEDFWTEERETFDGEFISKRLEARSALLYDILA